MGVIYSYTHCDDSENAPLERIKTGEVDPKSEPSIESEGCAKVHSSNHPTPHDQDLVTTLSQRITSLKNHTTDLENKLEPIHQKLKQLSHTFKQNALADKHRGEVVKEFMVECYTLQEDVSALKKAKNRAPAEAMNNEQHLTNLENKFVNKLRSLDQKVTNHQLNQSWTHENWHHFTSFERVPPVPPPLQKTQFQN